MLIQYPAGSSAFVGQTLKHFPQPVQTWRSTLRVPSSRRHRFSQVSIQGEPHSAGWQRFSLNKSSSFFDLPSGFWHQTQLRGQPLKKIVVLTPGPSSLQSLLMSNIRAFCCCKSVLVLSIRFSALVKKLQRVGTPTTIKTSSLMAGFTHSPYIYYISLFNTFLSK